MRDPDCGDGSTDVYWIPLFQILEKQKIQVRPVNAYHVRNVPGRKTVNGFNISIQSGFCAGLSAPMMRSVRSVHYGGTAIT